MTLLPIIYTSLLIFAGFLFFVIIGSYISYKMKSGGKGPVSQQIRIPQPAPIIAPVRTVQQNVMVKESYPLDYSKFEKRIQYQSNSLTKYRNNEADYQGGRRTIQVELPGKYSTSMNRFEQTRGRMNDRLRIMNTSEHFAPAAPVAVAKKVSSTNNFNDANVLNYYSDRNESGFVSLTAY